ncbi:FAD-dependent oxidoreductase [Micromonospora sp. WMMD975]|uniref:flavin monoamine oxidase family protein n=1 Tax=Micromonospora sp. WMMD975 TaxID=3016087 RepID=UPI00249A8788|nr:FAD-dependent oxidoreductase [Micromonospora sp. WMMD975]WFE36017.1 FAD-dependent oxidoreductase [Micromonospora sp. WMMD975]
MIVVGAGFSGLACALALHAADVDVLLVEARDRVGGRTLSRPLPDGGWLDLGAQWIGPTQDRMYALVAAYGLATFPSAAHGAPTLLLDGRRVTEPPAGLAGLLGTLDELAAGLDPAAPWRAAGAAEWDGTTLGGWLAATAPDPVTARYAGRLLAGGLLAVSPAEVSLLHLLFYLRSGGGADALLGMAGGAQQDRIVGGPAALAQRMADALPPARLRLDAPVDAVAQDRDGVRVRAGDETHRGDAVVVALAPALAGRIRYDPPLPALRDGLTQRMPMGAALKVHALYPEPFWRTAGRSGVATTDTGPLTETVDNSMPGLPGGVLTAFSYGAQARALRRLPDAARRSALRDALGALLGPAAADPENLIEYDWSADPWTRGCFGGVLTPGSWRDFGPELRAPVGRVHWAGTETATRWSGYLEGAVTAGERAAAEVLAALG